MVQKFKTLFDLTVKHTYYTSGYANDFVFSPTAQTAKDLSRYKLLARQKHGVNGSPEAYGLKVSYSEVDTAPLIPITATDSPSLVFGLNLKNTRFLNITNEVELPAFDERKILYYTTNLPGLSLVKSTLTLRRKVFELNFELTDPDKDKATVQILDESNAIQTKYTQNLENVDGNYQALIDLNGLDDGVYSVRVLKTTGLVEITTAKYYISDELAAMNPLAIVDLRLENNSDFSGTELEIDFTARSLRWKYWVVYRSVAANVPTVSGAPSTFADTVPSSTIDLSTLNSLEAQYPTANDVKLFVSDNPIDMEEEPVTNIKLNNNGVALIKHLPGMPVDSPKTEAYIFI